MWFVSRWREWQKHYEELLWTVLIQADNLRRRDKKMMEILEKMAAELIAGNESEVRT